MFVLEVSELPWQLSHNLLNFSSLSFLLFLLITLLLSKHKLIIELPSLSCRTRLTHQPRPRLENLSCTIYKIWVILSTLWHSSTLCGIYLHNQHEVQHFFPNRPTPIIQSTHSFSAWFYASSSLEVVPEYHETLSSQEYQWSSKLLHKNQYTTPHCQSNLRHSTQFRQLLSLQHYHSLQSIDRQLT